MKWDGRGTMRKVNFAKAVIQVGANTVWISSVRTITNVLRKDHSLNKKIQGNNRLSLRTNSHFLSNISLELSNHLLLKSTISKWEQFRCKKKMRWSNQLSLGRAISFNTVCKNA